MFGFIDLDPPPPTLTLYRLQKLTQLWHLNQDATENMVCVCMHVVFSFTINQSKRNQIDEHISNFQQYLASKKEGHKQKRRDSDTTGATATELKVRYPQNSGNLHTHTILTTCPHAQENEGNSKEEDDLQNSLPSQLRSATSSTTHNAGLWYSPKQRCYR